MKRSKLDCSIRLLIPAAVLVAVVSVPGCKHSVKPQPVAATAPPAAPAPTAKITASPSSVTAGDKVVLTWHTQDATTATIDGIGTVSSSGSRTVTPGSSTTYRLEARGQGGSADAEARVTVSEPPPAAAPANTMSAEEEFREHVKDIFFDYDKASVRTGDEGVLAKDAAYLEHHPNVKVLIGGYCDERGSEEFNMALGQNRAEAAKKALINAGIPASRLRDISYGKEKPFCSQESDSCWQLNRRAGFAMDVQ